MLSANRLLNYNTVNNLYLEASRATSLFVYMNRKELNNIIAFGESTTVEFKRKIASYEKIAKELVAFANTKGGCLIVGVDDNGTLYGIDSEKYETEALNICCTSYINPPIVPKIQIMQVKSKYLAVCTVVESDSKPHFLEYEENGQTIKQAYIRVGEKSMPASKEMTKILGALNSSSRPLTISIGDNEKRIFKYFEDHPRAGIVELAKCINVSKRRMNRIIVNLVRAKVVAIHADASGDYFTLY